MNDTRDPSGGPNGVEPLPVSRATALRLAAGVLAVYVVTILVILLVRAAGG